MDSPETRVREIAYQQHGTITRRQALAAGMTTDRIQRRARIGIWQRIHPGVYVVFGEAGPRTRLAAAVIALPAVVSHSSAAALHGLRGYTLNQLEVTIPHRLSNRLAAVTVHESTDLDPDHIVAVDRLQSTTVARTIFDLALRLKKPQLRSLVDDTIVRRLTSKDELSDMLQAVGRRGRPGTAAMRELVVDLAVRSVGPESELERLMIELIDRSGLPAPVLQMAVPWRSSVDGRVDIAFPDARVIVECDGRRWHTLAESFERDRRRDNLAQAAGWRVLRFTWDDVTRTPSAVVRQIRSVLQIAA